MSDPKFDVNQPFSRIVGDKQCKYRQGHRLFDSLGNYVRDVPETFRRPDGLSVTSVSAKLKTKEQRDRAKRKGKGKTLTLADVQGRASASRENARAEAAEDNA